jgi:hypothetical protein
MLGKQTALEKLRERSGGLDSFLLDASRGMLIPLVPLFLATALSAPALLIGLSESVPALLSSVALAIPPKVRRSRLFRASSLIIAAALRPLLSSSAAFTEFLAFRSAGSAAESAALPPKAEKPESQKSRPLCIFPPSSMRNLGGLLLGPILSLILLFLLLPQGGAGAYALIISLSSIPAFLALIPMLIKSGAKYESEKGENSQQPFPASFPAPMLASSLFLLSRIGIILFLFKASETLSPPLLVLAYVIFVSSSAAFSLPARLLSRALGQKRAFMLGALAFSMAALGFSLGMGGQYTLLLFALLGASSSTIGCAKRDSAIPIAQHYPALAALLLVFSNALAGILWETSFASMHAPFLASCALSLISIFAFAVYAEEDSRT